MSLLYYILLFGVFICISNFICDFSEKKKTANIKAVAVSVGTTLFIMTISRIIYFLGEPLLRSTAGILISYFIDDVISIALTVFAIYFISKIFRYYVSFPNWILIISIASIVVLCPLYIAYTKATFAYMDTLTSGNGITLYSSMALLSSTKYYSVLISILTKIPAIILTVFLIIKKITINRKA